ncbi:DUF393 domain-containing protein [Pedobacter aquatilis]|uniref:DUF393 domain-containing protein n=1 Tax=Pedobacter aquatilis TaxID=351343 RepID=UPI00292DD4F5|nr:DUF393 domain-containing protein [Pedobacter aquatilis]
MKTLANHLILFDNECPMCFAYTKAFTKLKMLPVDGREAYQNMPEEVCPFVDKKRAANEIALVNKETGEVTYGIESLFKVIETSFPIFKTLFRFSPFLWIAQKCYAFISYNRKVIIPAEVNANNIQPDFSLKHRLMFLFLTWLITSFILTNYTQHLTDFIPIGYKYREYMICGTQIFFQGFIIYLNKKDKLFSYLGNMMTISFAGALLLIIPLILNNWIEVHPIFYLLYFLFTAGLMFLEHIRRSKILGLNLVMSFTWVFYRLIVLGVILVLAL